MKKRGILGFLLFLLSCVGAATTGLQYPFHVAKVEALTNCTVGNDKVGNDSEEQKFLGLINTYRQQHGLVTLKISTNLNRAAAWQSVNMLQRKLLSHTDSLGRNPQQRMFDCGLARTTSLVAENILDGSPGAATTAQQAITLWKNSPEHNANMLQKDIRFIGIARETNGSLFFWTTDFSSSDTTPTTPQPTTPPVKPTTPPAVSANSMVLAFTVFLDGIGQSGDRSNPGSKGNQNPHYQQRTITVGIRNKNDALVAAQPAIVTYNPKAGNFTGNLKLTGLPTGSYTVKIKADRYLRKTLPGFMNLAPGKTWIMPTVTLIAGDINGDNIIDIKDYNILMGCYSDIKPAKSCTSANKILSDLSDDAKVNQVDYNLFIREMAVRAGD